MSQRLPHRVRRTSPPVTVAPSASGPPGTATRGRGGGIPTGSASRVPVWNTPPNAVSVDAMPEKRVSAEEAIRAAREPGVRGVCALFDAGAEA